MDFFSLLSSSSFIGLALRSGLGSGLGLGLGLGLGYSRVGGLIG